MAFTHKIWLTRRRRPLNEGLVGAWTRDLLWQPDEEPGAVSAPGFAVFTEFRQKKRRQVRGRGVLATCSEEHS